MVTAPIISAILPLLLWPIEFFLPYPYIIEEIAKAGIILLIVKSKADKNDTATQAILAGVLFSLTETLLYMFNIPPTANGNMLLTRFILTTPMHIATMLTILVFTSKNRSLLPIGVVLAVVIHYLYNNYIPLLVP